MTYKFCREKHLEALESELRDDADHTGCSIAADNQDDELDPDREMKPIVIKNGDNKIDAPTILEINLMKGFTCS